MATNGHDIFEFIRSRRKALGMTQRRLALLAGCGVVTVIKLEAGDTHVRLDKTMDILNVLGLTLNFVDVK